MNHTGNLYINGKDAFAEYGASMGDGFLDTLLLPAPLKEFVENKSRLDNGKEILHDNPRVDERDVTLTFFLEGATPEDYRAKYRAFVEQLLKGKISLRVPATGETYRLTYRASSGYAGNRRYTFSKISVKFNESNPADRGNS